MARERDVRFIGILASHHPNNLCLYNEATTERLIFEFQFPNIETVFEKLSLHGDAYRYVPVKEEYETV